MSEVTNIATRIALVQAQLSRNLAELTVAQRTAANNLVIGRLESTIARQEQELAQLQTQLAQAQQRAALGTASAGNLARDDQQATVSNSRSQAPQPAAEVLTPEGRIQPQPDTTTATTATQPVTEDSEDSGTNAPVRTITNTQATPAFGPGLLTDPGDADAQPGGYYGGGVAPAATQAGSGAASEDRGEAKNATRQEIDNVFSQGTIVPQPNVLDQYSSYTWSASVYLMTADAYREMVRTKRKTLAGSQLLFQSGGAPVTGRNEFFTNDYYIDKITLESTISGKGTNQAHNVNQIKMTVIEPNGITLINNLDRALNGFVGAEQKKKNFNAQQYLLVIRFYGYDDQGQLVQGGRSNPRADGSTDPNSFVEKFYPMCITNIRFKVANKLVEYDIEATAPTYNVAVGSNRGSIPYNVELSSGTVKDVLLGPLNVNVATTTVQARGGDFEDAGDRFETTTNTNSSTLPPAPAKANAAPSNKTTIRKGLMAALNAFQEQLVQQGTYTYPDVYSVEFANASIADASIVIKGQDKKSKPMANDPTAAGQKDPRKQSQDNTGRNVAILAGTQIVQVLDQILKNSSYITDQATVSIDENTQEQKSNGPPANNLAWYKISLVASPRQYDYKRNDYAYDIKYIISAYKINQMVSDYFLNPRFSGTHKQYNYWFTGENTQVLSYEQTYNSLYSAVLSGGPGGQIVNEAIKRNFQPRSGESSQGAAGRTNEIGANAADYLYNPNDLQNVTIQIIGDPAWLQQGEAMGAISARNFNFAPFLPDGTINFDSQQTLFEILINTPNDYDLSTGLIDPNTQNTVFENGSRQPGAARQSYVYLCNNCTSEFVKGKFTQTLKGSLMTFLPDQTFKEQQQINLGQQQLAINNLSPNRQILSGSSLTNVLGASSLGISALPFLPATQSLQSFGLNSLVSAVPGSQRVFGALSTRPVSIPALPTSFGLPVGTTTNASALRLPGAVTNFAQTVSDATTGAQRTIRGVVDSVSTGTTQTVAATDDAGTGEDFDLGGGISVRDSDQVVSLDTPVAEFDANNDFFG